MVDLLLIVESARVDPDVILAAANVDLRIETDIFDVTQQRRLSHSDEKRSWANSVVGELLLFRSDPDGTLRIARSGVEIAHVPASVDFESWQVWGDDGSGWVCMPGGEIAHWGPRLD